ncbi:MAG: hypothetical protein ACOZF2_04075 [Thermodesulfobacteriota bacterium]
MEKILQGGLYQDQLNQLIQFCENNIESDPTTFFVLKSIFEKILFDFWEQEIAPKEDYLRLEKALIPRIVEVWESSSQQRKVALDNLIRAHKNFVSSSH